MNDKVKQVRDVGLSFSTVCINFLETEVRKDEPKSDGVIMTGMVTGFLNCVAICLDEEFDDARAVMHRIDDILFNFLVIKDKD